VTRDDPSPNRRPDRPHRKPRNYFARREQVRLIALVFSLLLVCFLIVECGKPKVWRSFFGEPPPTSAPIGSTDPSIDTRLAQNVTRPESLPEGVFVSPADLRRNDDDVTGDDVMGSRAAHRVVATRAGDRPPTAADYALVQDDTVFRAPESAAWYKLLTYLKDVDANELSASALGPISFAQLYKDPKAFRGRVVEVSGEVRRAHFLDAPKNDFQIDGYWQCWLMLQESPDPIVVYALELPHGFPQGMKLREPVSFTGVFFKRWAYSSASGPRVAPLIVAGRGDWKPESATVARPLPTAAQVAAIIVSCALCAAALAWLVNRLARWTSPQRSSDEVAFVALGNEHDLRSVEQATEGYLGALEMSETDE
jgi:hypothetical protein